MSLINEALKKAQRLRHEGAAQGSADDGPVVQRPQPKSAKSMLIIAVGAVMLVVLSMVFTAVWITRPSAPRIVDPKIATVSATSDHVALPPSVILPISPNTPAATGAVAVSAPVNATQPSAASANTASPGAPVATDRAVPPTADAPGTSAPSPANAGAVESPPRPAPPPPTPDERVHKFVESLKVTGIRSSGNESKVLMNDRVYRVNDVVDRALGVRLTKVSPDNLTFTDANGAVYVKFF